MPTNSGRDLAVVVMAAGKGKRMGNPDLAKVLASLDGRPLLGYVLEEASHLHPATIVVVVGHQHEAVRAFVASNFPAAQCVLQAEQLGTGHAVQQAENAIGSSALNVLVLSGDVPLLTAATLNAFAAHHLQTNATLTVLSTTVPDPTGYGRIVRDAAGSLQSIVEQKDATAAETAIAEINSGIYLVRTEALFSALKRVQNSNAQAEFYLTDIVAILKSDGEHVEAFYSPRWEELHGINTVADLEHASQLRMQRQVEPC